MTSVVSVWPMTALGELCTLVRGISPTMKTEPGSYPLVVTAEYRRTASTYQLEGPAVCVPLISSTGHGHAALHRVHYQEGKFALANLLVALIPRDPVRCYAKYVYYLLQTRKDDYFVPLMQGTANVSLKEADIASVLIPLPPLDEQRRIVARIEALATRIAEACRLRREALAEGEAFLKAVLLREFAPRVGAHTVTVDSICEAIVDNLHSNPVYSDDGIPCVRSPDVGWGVLNLATALKTSDAEYRRRTVRGEPRPGDIVIVREGGGTGKAALVEEDQRFSLGQRVMMIRPNKTRILPKYLLFQLLSPTFRTPEYALFAIFSYPDKRRLFLAWELFEGTGCNKGRLLHGESIFA
jgi:Type I restriction modification DNA specificity domain